MVGLQDDILPWSSLLPVSGHSDPTSSSTPSNSEVYPLDGPLVGMHFSCCAADVTGYGLGTLLGGDNASLPRDLRRVLGLPGRSGGSNLHSTPAFSQRAQG